MIKNQHLLGSLVVLGAINVLAFFGLISGERDSARALKGLERDLAASRAEQGRAAENLGHELAKVREEQQRLTGNLEDAQSVIAQLRGDMDKARTRLLRNREELDALEKRLDKIAPATQKDSSKETGQ
jgi:septal ring factor EnvC (AmiA/AmiB activator)